MNLPANAIDLKLYQPSDLVTLRNRIDEELGLDLTRLDLNQELLVQFRMARLMLQDVQNDEEVAVNHKTGMVNSLTTLLKELASAQQTLYTATRVQTIERVLTSVLKDHPEISDEFMEAYKSALSGL